MFGMSAVRFACIWQRVSVSSVIIASGQSVTFPYNEDCGCCSDDVGKTYDQMRSSVKGGGCCNTNTIKSSP